MSMFTRSRSALFSVAAAGGILIGGAGIAAAATHTGSPQNSPSVAQQAGTQSPSYTGSISAPENGEQDPTQEAAALQGLAKISPQQATDAALARVAGTPGTVQLENENGFVVYNVQVTDAKGVTSEVKVDAGNGTVLDVAAADSQEGDANGTAEAPDAANAGSSQDAAD